MGNKKYIEEFENYNRSKGLASATIITQTKLITYFADKIEKDLTTVNKTDIENYINFLENKGYAKTSIEQFKSIVKKFYKWLHNRNTDKEITTVRQQMEKDGKTQLEIDRKEWELRNYRPKYPMNVEWIKPKLIQTTKSEKDVFKPEQIYKLIDVCDNPQHKAMFSLMWDLGLRVGQLCDIKLKDLTITENKIDISFKLDWEEIRTVPTIESTPALFEWINNHPYKNDPNRHLFISFSRPRYGERYSECGIWGLLEKIRKRAGLNKHISSHLIRHSRTTYWKKTGVDSATIKFIGLWKMNSQIPDTVYNHQVANDYRNNVITATTGIPTIHTPERNPIGINYCPRCGEGNPATNQYCVKCREPLTGLAKQKQEELIKEQIAQQVKELLRLETEPNIKVFDKPVEDIIKHPEEPSTVTVVEKQVMPTQEQLYQKYIKLERIVNKLKQS